MKFARFLCNLVILGMLALVANAQTPVDPKVIINLDPPVPACNGTGQPVCYAGGTPLIENYNSPNGFIYTGTPPLEQLILEFTNVPTNPATPFFSCQTNIWSECATSFDSSTDIETFFMAQPPGALAGVTAPCDFNDHIFGNCPNVLLKGQGATITFDATVSATPEPASFFLFGSGIVLVIMIAKRRYGARSEFA